MMIKHTTTKTLGLLAAGGLLLGTGSAPAALLLHYTFDGNDAANSGTLVGDGIVSGGVAFGPSGADGGGPSSGSAAYFNRTSGNTAAVSTTFDPGQLGITGGGNYTAMAWIRFDGAANDNMVFGQDVNAGGGTPGATLSGGTQLHHGVRNDGAGPTSNMHAGHWGNDITDQGTAVPTDGTWVHVAWTYDAANTTLTQYLNGVQNGQNTTAAALGNTASLVTIGWNDRQGSFDGAIDDVKIFDELLDATEIQAEAVVIPEPSTGLLALLSAGLLLRRRK